MLDFLKAKIVGVEADTLLQNQLLEFSLPFCPDTDEIKTWSKSGKGLLYQRAFYNGLEIRIYLNGSIYLFGSLHKYMNNGHHNNNDFSTDNLILVLIDLSSKLGIEPHHMHLQQLEFGINLILNHDVNNLLDSFLLHRKKPFERRKVSNGYYKCVNHSNLYELKYYNKTAQQKTIGIQVPDNLLRIEVKYKPRQLKLMGIHTMADYLSIDNHILLNDLLYHWNEIVMYDWTIAVENQKDQQTLLKYQSQIFWNNLVKEGTASQYRWAKDKLDVFIKNHSHNIKQEIADIIKKKGSRLLTTTLMYHSDKVNNEVVNAPIKRRCHITNVDISIQRKGSQIASVKGLNNLYKTDPNKFMDLSNKYLSKRKLDKFISVIDQTITALSSSISNRYNNNRKKIEKGEQLQPIKKQNRKK